MKRHLIKILFLNFLLLVILDSYGQHKIAGTVVSQKDGTPLAGASIKVSGTNQITKTDQQGRYSITTDSYKLEAYLFGYKYQTISFIDEDTINFFLKKDPILLAEITITAEVEYRKEYQLKCDTSIIKRHWFQKEKTRIIEYQVMTSDTFNIKSIENTTKDTSITFVRYLVKNIQYPQEAIEDYIEGTSYTLFSIDSTFSIENITHPSTIPILDDEVNRVIKQFPNNFREYIFTPDEARKMISDAYKHFDDNARISFLPGLGREMGIYDFGDEFYISVCFRLNTIK